MSMRPKRAEQLVRIRGLVLCDQMRTEDNGKHILIGVYDAGLGAPAFPSISTLVCYGAFELVADDVRTIEFRLAAPGSSGIGQIVLNEGLKKGAAAPFLANISFLAERPGELKFDWRADNSSWAPPIRWGLALAEGGETLPPEAAQQVRVRYAMLRPSLEAAATAQVLSSNPEPNPAA